MIVIHVHNIKTLRDRSEGNFWAYRPATALRPGPPQNLNLFFFWKTNEKGPMFVERLCFFSNYVGLPIFQNFRHKFFTRFSTNLTHVSGYFCGGVEMRPIWAAHPPIIAYIFEVTAPAPTPPPFKGAPK